MRYRIVLQLTLGKPDLTVHHTMGLPLSSYSTSKYKIQHACLLRFSLTPTPPPGPLLIPPPSLPLISSLSLPWPLG